ncbi:MAG TPA: helix-turn-helix domain-containing protein [Ktedonobacteraceae bacterium]|nr:helix-turn-helix domain-containing protein [Ktedonobacteraceae bacterium]
MADIHEFPDIPGYVSIKQAAQMLGITDKRVYRYIDIGRLPAFKASGVFLLAEEDVKQFKLNPPGRIRTSPPRWRVYSSRSKVFSTEIQVHVQPGKHTNLLEKLKAIQQANRHTFPGTIARYVIKGDEALTSVHFVLLWKDTEMPDEVVQQHDLKALQEELKDVLDWETAIYTTNEALMYT